MLTISKSDAIYNTELFKRSLDTVAIKGFTMTKFINKSLIKAAESDMSEYPKIIKLPKSLDRLSKGDFEPAKTLLIEKPLTMNGLPIWRGNALDGVSLRLGYINGDSRMIIDSGIKGPKVHGMIAAATGQGKSVAINVLAYGLVLEYAPWSVKLIMTDPKRVEFLPFAKDFYTPHIDTVAATADVDYTISALQYMCRSMDLTNSALSKVNAKNLVQLEQFTGLTLPRYILLMEELETQLNKAGKKQNLLLKCIDELTKMGRNTGYNIIASSQNVPSDLPAAIKNNMTYRVALGCVESTSTLLIGNKEAKDYMGKVGRAIVNLEFQNGDVKDNIHLVVPYPSPEEMMGISANLRGISNEIGYKSKLNYYDDKEVVPIEEVPAWVEKLNFKEKSILIGEPSYISKDRYGVLRLYLDKTDIENICVYGNTKISQSKMLAPIVHSFSRLNEQSFIALLEKEYTNHIDYESTLSPKIVCNETSFYSNKAINFVCENIRTRVMAAKIESVVYNIELKFNEEAPEYIAYREFISSIIDELPNIDTELNKRRYFTSLYLMNTDPGLSRRVTGNATLDSRESISQNVLMMLTSLGYSTKQFFVEELKHLNLWILGMDRLMGICRGPDTSVRNMLVTMLQDAYTVNCRIIIAVKSIEECTDIVPFIRWFVCYGLDNSAAVRMKCHVYPDHVLETQGVLFTPTSDGEKCQKFKLVYIDDDEDSVVENL